ncbi:MAG TPA: hypothetical protein ENK24_04790 [Anaerolineae bacterium]|nr:hypothetical protein [Anaerolineae bacterium]
MARAKQARALRQGDKDAIMLHKVLNEFETAQGALNLNDLARNLNVERSALEGMIQFWVRKGRIKDSLLANSADLAACSSAGSCAGSCSGPQGCPYVMEMPRILSYVKK